jgi:hypothetical protein
MVFSVGLLAGLLEEGQKEKLAEATMRDSVAQIDLSF